MSLSTLKKAKKANDAIADERDEDTIEMEKDLELFRQGQMKGLPLDMDSKHMVEQGYKIKRYRNHYLYVVNDTDVPGEVDAVQRLLGITPQPSEHTFLCTAVKAMFGKLFDCEIKSVVIPDDAGQEWWDDYWAWEIKEWGSDTMVYVWYEGSAGGEDREFSIKPESNSRGWINVYETFEEFAKSNAAVLCIFEALMQTRFTEKWSTEGGPFEIIHKATSMADPDGKVMKTHGGNLTRSFVSDMAVYMELLQKEKAAEVKEQERAEQKGRKPRKINHGGRRALSTILELQASDKTMYSNPLHEMKDKPVAGSEKLIQRLKFDPLLCKKSGKFEMYGVEIQGPNVGIKTRIPRQLGEAERARNNSSRSSSSSSARTPSPSLTIAPMAPPTLPPSHASTPVLPPPLPTPSPSIARAGSIFTDEGYGESRTESPCPASRYY